MGLFQTKHFSPKIIRCDTVSTSLTALEQNTAEIQGFRFTCERLNFPGIITARLTEERAVSQTLTQKEALIDAFSHISQVFLEASLQHVWLL